ncbi:MAG: hypothetical protein FWC50_04520 [Planctomycetaceae bacterium]|nr:hypothetical protein [Planctomycetaceae bacterium]
MPRSSFAQNQASPTSASLPPYLTQTGTENRFIPMRLQQGLEQAKVTRQTQFAIPFQLGEETKRKPPAEIELVYSIDQGTHWYSYQKVPPDKKTFDFSAPSDGEYWFVFRTVGQNGEIKQVGESVPALKIVVDTEPPKLVLEASRGNSGEIIVKWSANDDHLKKATADISISYDDNISWMTLAVDPKNIMRDGTHESGFVPFWPKHEASTVNIRCELEDIAGNREIQTTRFALNKNVEIPNPASSNSSDTKPASNFDGYSSQATSPQATLPEVLPVAPPRPMTHEKTPLLQNIPVTPTTSLSLAAASPIAAVPEPSVASTAAASAVFDAPKTSDLPVNAPPGNTQPAIIPTTNFVVPGSPANQPVNRQANPPTNPTAGSTTNSMSLDSLLTMFGEAPQATAANAMPRYSENAGVTNANMTTVPQVPQMQETAVAPTPTTPQAETSQADAATNGKTQTPGIQTSEALPPEAPFPGKIGLVSLGSLNNQPYLIVQWLAGDKNFATSKADIYRSQTKNGPWMPVAFDLANSGEYHWSATEIDRTPFFLRIDLRTPNGLYTDFTNRLIAVPAQQQTPSGGK